MHTFVVHTYVYACVCFKCSHLTWGVPEGRGEKGASQQRHPLLPSINTKRSTCFKVKPIYHCSVTDSYSMMSILRFTQNIVSICLKMLSMAMLVCPDGVSSILNRAISQGVLPFLPLACTITLWEANSTVYRLHHMMVKWIYHKKSSNIQIQYPPKSLNLLSTEWAT